MTRAFLVSVVLALACSSPTSPADDLAISVAANQASFNAGDTVRISMTVANHGNRDVQITWSSCPILPFSLTDATGVNRGMGLTTGGCLLLLNSVEIAPRDSAAFSVIWAGSVQESSGLATVLGAGTYRIHPRLAIASGEVVVGKVPLSIGIVD